MNRIETLRTLMTRLSSMIIVLILLILNTSCVSVSPSGNYVVANSSSTNLGSSGSFIRVFNHAQIKQVGKAIKYVSNSIDGDHFLILKDGTYSINYSDSRIGGILGLGISLNATIAEQKLGIGTSPGPNFNSNHVLAINNSAGAALYGQVNATVDLKKGDIIRAHVNNKGEFTLNSKFRIHKVSN